MTDTSVIMTYPCANTSCDRLVSELHSYCCGLCASRRDRGIAPPHSALCRREKPRV